MRSLLAGLFLLPIVSVAAPFKTTSVSMSINRQSIYDQKDHEIATAAPFTVRYSESDEHACFIMVYNGEVPCVATRGIPSGDLYISVWASDLKAFFVSLIWTVPAYEMEFETLYVRSGSDGVNFSLRNSKSKTLTVKPFQVITDDKKTIYSVY